ncbi:hypothetical protein PENTCL1PPCAC_20974, partial [Pristionchus entomophagus]
QFEMILKENENIVDRANVFRNLVKISNRQRFMQKTYDIFANSGLQFASDHIIIGGSLSISADMYNSVGLEVVKSVIAPLLKMENDKSEVHNKLLKAFPNKGVDWHLTRIVESENVWCEKFRKKNYEPGKAKPFYSAMFYQFIDKLLKQAQKVEPNIFPIWPYWWCFPEQRKFFETLEMHLSARETELNPSCINRHVKIARLSELISQFAPRRKEFLLRATITARKFAQSMKNYKNTFQGVTNSDLLKAGAVFRDRMYDRAAGSSRKIGTKDQVELVKNHASAVVQDLEDKAAFFFAEVNSFVSGQFERMIFKCH